MAIEIGSVVRLSGGGPRMTVIGIAVKSNGEVTPASEGNGCVICGPYPRLESSDGQVMATMLLAQQQWRARHDAHVKLESRTALQCVWMDGGDLHESGFPIEALHEVVDEDDDDVPRYQHRRHRRIRRYRVREDD